MPDPSPPNDPVLEAVAALIREVVGEDWAAEVAIVTETSFSDDLELESIEFVALAERMQTRFGDDVDFAAWLATMSLDAIIGLTVGQVVDHVKGRLAAGAT